MLVYALGPDLASKVQAADEAEAGPGYPCLGGLLPDMDQSMGLSLPSIDGYPAQIGVWVPGAPRRHAGHGRGARRDRGVDRLGRPTGVPMNPRPHIQGCCLGALALALLGCADDDPAVFVAPVAGPHVLDAATAYGWSGYSLAAAGDVDADGHLDILVSSLSSGTGGHVALLRGPIRGDLTVTAPDAAFTGEYGFANLGDAGRSELPSELDLASAPWTFATATPGDHFGETLAVLGDLDDDGRPDFGVTAKNREVGAVGAGAVDLFLAGRRRRAARPPRRPPSRAPTSSEIPSDETAPASGWC